MKIIVFKFSSTARELASKLRWRCRDLLQRRREAQFVEMAGGLQALATLNNLKQAARRRCASSGGRV